MKVRHYVRNVANINNNTEKTIEKNYGSKQRKSMNKTRNKYLTETKKKLNALYVRLK